MNHQEMTFADCLAGGGGATDGALSVPGIKVLWALNHDETAIKTNSLNHPETKYFQTDFTKQDVRKLEKVNGLWVSLECQEHSNAKGGQEKNIGSFMLGWELPKYIMHCDPAFIIIENVPEFVKWGELKKGKRVKHKEGQEYVRWINYIKRMGWTNYDYRFLNAADYGAPTRRIRYFGIFSKPEYQITWPEQTHCQFTDNLFGLPKWKACKDYIDLTNEGNSIFGREFNEDIRKNKRHPLSKNTLRRIAGGIKKFAPDIHFIMKYYGAKSGQYSSINEPLHTVTTKDRHALVTVEKKQFITDHVWVDSLQQIDEPLKTILTRETKQLITIDKKFVSDGTWSTENKNFSVDEPINTLTGQERHQLISAKAQFIGDYYGRDNANQSINKPANTITGANSKHLVTTKAQFISPQYNSNGKPEANNQSIDEPLKTITTEEKFQFITAFFNSAGNPESQNQDIDNPLNSITTVNKHALVTAIENGLIDFDIKMRFLNDDELASIMGFPKGYFKQPGLKLSKKKIIKMIGNAVPTHMAQAIIEKVKESFLEVENAKQAV